MVMSGEESANNDEYIASKSPIRQCNTRKEGDEGKQPLQNLKKNEVMFSNKSESYCISFIDIVGSTQITSKLDGSKKIEKFYSIFINEVAGIVKNHNGKVLKTTGDGVIFFFPETSNPENIEAFRDAIECLLSFVSSRTTINAKLYKEKIPAISYRISADYGRMEVAMSGETNSSDLFGSTVNFCAKMNRRAPANGIAIGGDLRMMVNSFPTLANRYGFQEIEELARKTNRYSYPLYLLFRRTEERNPTMHTILKMGMDKDGIGTTPKPLTILLVDDDPSILLLFTQYLKSADMIVDSFTDPEKALTQFIESDYRRYDLVITDIRMNKLNGFELYQQLKTFDPTVRIMFVTALDIIEETTTLLSDVKVNQFITKPVNSSILINTVKQLAKRYTDGQ